MTEDQIKHMVDRFLAWKLPDSFNPDGGVSFKRLENRYHHPDASPFYPMPTGTNLLDAAQADAMVRYMLDGLPEPPAPAAGMAPSGEPKAWYYEERHTDAQGTFWSRHLDYKRPEESPRRRNITPLFLAPDVVSPAAESPSKFSPGPAVEIRKQDDAIDEIVIRRSDVHIEQMSADGWYMGVDASDGSYWQFWFGAKNRKSHVEFRHTETHHPDVADFTAPKDHFPAGSGWQPMETAPKDGTPVLLFFPKRYQQRGGVSWGCFIHGEWLDSRSIRDNDASHWMPMPSFPSTERGQP